MISILGLNLPFYIVITLLFAYLLWSKFLKQTKIKPENTNDIFDILVIFASLIGLFLSLFVPALLIGAFLNINLESEIMTIWSRTTFLVTFFSILGIIYLLGFYRKKRPSRKDLKNIYTIVIQFYLILMFTFIGLLIIINLTSLRYTLWDLIFFIPAIFLVIWVIYNVNDLLPNLKVGVSHQATA